MTSQAYRARKGQSAIEYLTTYGWALLAIIIVGAVLVNMGIFGQCQTISPQFSGQQVALESWAWQSSSSMSLTVQSIKNDINISQVAFDWDDDGTYEDAVAISPETVINAGQTGAVSATSLSTTSGECARGNLQITYNMQDGSATGLLASGSGKIGGPVP